MLVSNMFKGPLFCSMHDVNVTQWKKWYSDYISPILRLIPNKK